MNWSKVNNNCLKNKYYIYKITNLINNKIYIGLTNNYKRRFIQHKSKLKNNKHSNFHLQNAFNKYGRDYFIFEVVNYFNNINDANEAEKQYIRIYNSDNRNWGYNIDEGGEVSLRSKETIEKISKKAKKRFKNKKNHPMYKKVQSIKTIEKIKKTKTGKKQTLKQRKKTSDSLSNNGIFGTTGAVFAEKNNYEGKCWRAMFYYNNKQKSLGYYEDPFTCDIINNLIKKEIYRGV